MHKKPTIVKGYQVSQTGGIEQLRFQDLELPSFKPNQALVRLHAIGVNYVDVGQRLGIYPLTTPFVPGREGAGVVERIGDDVTTVKPGDRVAFTEQQGTYAEAIVVDAKSLIPLPQDFDYVQGAAFPLQGMTAHYLVHDFHKINANDTVLIHAAAGGMGLLLVQWAKHLGARVFGTVSTKEKAAKVKNAGADEVILYSKTDFAVDAKRLTDGQGVSLIIDGVGKDTFTKNFDAIAERGHIILFGAASGPAESMMPSVLMNKCVTISGGSLSMLLSTREELLHRANSVINGINEGWLKLSIETMSFSDAAKAQTLIETRKTTGKIVLAIDT